jgi:hypothetical protein
MCTAACAFERRTRCVDAVIREVQCHFHWLAQSCDHDIIALAYLRTTEEYRRTIEDPTFFEDTAFVNHEDVVFARLHFDAFDAWQSGRSADVPRAWAIAFQATTERERQVDERKLHAEELSRGIDRGVDQPRPRAPRSPTSVAVGAAD